MNKIDLIIDALRLGLRRCPAREMGHFEQALAAARSLQELKPVAFSYVSYGDKVFIDSPDKVLMAKNLKYKLTKLYALDEVKHD